MKSNFQNYYTVIAIDEDWDRCFVKFIGVYSTYELAKGATTHHHNNFGDEAECDRHYDYKFFFGELDKNYETDYQDDLLHEENHKEYEFSTCKTS